MVVYADTPIPPKHWSRMASTLTSALVFLFLALAGRLGKGALYFFAFMWFFKFAVVAVIYLIGQSLLCNHLFYAFWFLGRVAEVGASRSYVLAPRLPPFPLTNSVLSCS